MDKLRMGLKRYKKLIIVLNIIGIVIFLYLVIPYIRHDEFVFNSNTMLNGPFWDMCGFLLVLGFIPLLLVNVMAYFVVNLKSKSLRVLCLVPSVICMFVVGHYLLIATDWTDDVVKRPVVVMRCSVDGDEFHYQIFLEDNGEYSLGMDEWDDIPLNIVDYTDQDTMIASIKEYYQSNGGVCF